MNVRYDLKVRSSLTTIYRERPDLFAIGLEQTDDNGAQTISKISVVSSRNHQIWHLLTGGHEESRMAKLPYGKVQFQVLLA